MDALKNKTITLYCNFLEGLRKGYNNDYQEILLLISFINLPVKLAKHEFIKQRLLNKDDTDYLNLNINKVDNFYSTQYNFVEKEKNFLQKNNYLSEFSSDLEKRKVRENLGISDAVSMNWGNISGFIEHLKDLVQYVELIKSNTVLNINIGTVSSLDRYTNSGVYSGMLNNNPIMLIVVSEISDELRKVAQILYELDLDEILCKLRLGKGYNQIIWKDWFTISLNAIKQLVLEEISKFINLPEQITQQLSEIIEWVRKNEDVYHLLEQIQTNTKAIQEEKIRAEYAEQQLLKIIDKTVYLSAGDYEQLIIDGLVQDDVEYNIFEDE